MAGRPPGEHVPSCSVCDTKLMAPGTSSFEEADTSGEYRRNINISSETHALSSSPPASSNSFQVPKWRKPRPLGYGNAVESLGSVASPLLAGFSLASVIMTSDDAANFRWPGMVIFALAVAAVLLIAAVQFGYNARQYFWSAADVREWWPDMQDGSDRETVLREEQGVAFGRWRKWTWWMRMAYNLGVLALMAGLAFALAPRSDSDTQADWRWVAVWFVFAACVAEAGWIILGFCRRFWQTRGGRLT
jgi:MFS family permease